LPLSGKKVEYRPFVVREEKVLLMAAETKNEDSIHSAIREVVLACTGGKVDVTKIPLIDMEYLFLQLRSHSVGETTTPSVKCEKCGVPNECEINLKQVIPQVTPDHRKVIPIISDISVVMKYPTIDDVKAVEGETEVEKTFSLLVRCIDKVVQGETTYNASEMDESEVRDFVEQMTQDQFRRLFGFLETMPKMEKSVEFTCKGCKQENRQVLKGIASFF
jgi:DNA-directed RNA polymerase subunit M/transcription elongation factor TFIIS